MPSNRKPSLILPVAGAAALLLASYVGAYYWLVERSLVPQLIRDGLILETGYDATYRSGQTSEAFFTPMLRLDKAMRPGFWSGAEHETSRIPAVMLPVAFAIAVLMAGYVGSYYATVTPNPNGPAYPSMPPSWKRVLAPIHWLDRRIRPYFWG